MKFVELLKRFREVCAQEADSEAKTAQLCNLPEAARFVTYAAKHIREIDVEDWLNKQGVNDAATKGA